VLITKLDLVFQPLAKFPDSRNVTFKVFPEGTTIVNPNSGHGIYHIVTLIFIIIVTTLSLVSTSLGWWSLCLEGIWVVLVSSGVVFSGRGLDVPRKVVYDSFLLEGKIWVVWPEQLVPGACR